MRIVNAFVDFDTNQITLVARDNGVKRRQCISGQLPYLCVKRTDATSYPVLEKTESRYIKKIEHEGEYSRLYTHFIGMIPKLRDFLEEKNIKTYESDIPFVRQVMIDKKIKIGSEPLKFLLIDIETDDSGKNIDMEKYPILSIGCMNLEGKKGFFCTNSEKETLTNFASILKDYDVLVAWNGDGFDFPYLKKRFEIHKIFCDWREFQFIDDMQLVAKGYEKLDVAGQKYVKIGKIKDDRKIIELYNKDRPKLCEYNMRDVEIMFEIEKKLNLLKLQETLSERSNCFIGELRFPTTIVDTMILNKVKELDLPLRFPYKPGSNTGTGFLGGFVQEPPVGLFQNIIVLDFTSLYNRIMQTFNISPETVGGKDIFIPDSQVSFSKRKGLIPHILETLEEDRNNFKRLRNASPQGSEEYKKYDLLQNSVKIVLLSFYGVMGSPGSRYYLIDVAESVTKTGQWLIKESKKIIEEEGYKVLYMDTDSMMIHYTKDGDIVEEGKRLTQLLNDKYKEILKQFNILPEKNKIEMKFEKVFSKIIFNGVGTAGTKKRYAALQTWEEGNPISKVNITGLEYVRRDINSFARKLQKDIIDMLLIENADFVKIHTFLNERRGLVVDKKLTVEEVTIKQGLKQAPEKYKSKTPHVRVALKMKELGEELVVGQRVAYFYSEGDVKPISQYNGDYDAMIYWNDKIFPPTERVLASVFPDVNWRVFYIEKPKKDTQTLKHWFEI